MPDAWQLANATYCAPYGGVNTYRPMFVPDGVGFLRPPKLFDPFGNSTRLVPVLRYEDHHSVHFYYYGDGCSDTHILVNSQNGLVAHDRLDAVRRLYGHKALKTVIEWCTHSIESAAAQTMPSMLLKSGSHPNIDSVRSLVSGGGCLNEPLYQIMVVKGLDTLVLNYEAPGQNLDASLTFRKTEIIYLGSSFYDSNGTQCSLTSHRGCYYCNNSVRSRATCNGTLGDTVLPSPTSLQRTQATLTHIPDLMHRTSKHERPNKNTDVTSVGNKHDDG